MSPRLKMIVLAALCVAQLGAAGWSIVKYESILASGMLYRIRVAPVDPADAFRGRYVAVQPSIAVPQPIAPETKDLLDSLQDGGGTAFVRLATDAEGFARADQVVKDAPDDGNYLKIDRAWPDWRQRPENPGESEQIGYRLMFPFDRYYMNEAGAPAAERRFSDAARRNTESRAWLSVRVKDGVGVIEGLFIDGVPIEEVVRR